MSNPPDRERCRAGVLAIYGAALAAVNGGTCVRDFLIKRPPMGDILAVAIGKAAGAMMEGAAAALGTRLHAGLVITKEGYGDAVRSSVASVKVLEAGHPLPDERSLAAGRALLEFIASSAQDGRLLFLVSGGASSLVEVLPPGMGLGDLQRVNQWLLASGWDIHRMNTLRKRLSRIKGGRLAAHLRDRKVLQLLISDVPGDAPADIGSGLLVAAAETPIVESELPAWLRALLQSAAHSPMLEASSFAGIETHIVASLDQALAAAGREAQRLSHGAHIHAARLSGDAAAAGRRVAREALQGANGVHIWGGETTVELPPHPGRGGRSQQLALAAAAVLAGHDKVCLLAAGTDGSDGPGEDAGAAVDGGTIARGELDGLNAADCLRRADAGSFLEASGDLISTGPTGTNVTDLVIALKV